MSNSWYPCFHLVIKSINSWIDLLLYASCYKYLNHAWRNCILLTSKYMKAVGQSHFVSLPICYIVLLLFQWPDPMIVGTVYLLQWWSALQLRQASEAKMMLTVNQGALVTFCFLLRSHLTGDKQHMAQLSSSGWCWWWDDLWCWWAVVLF